MFVDCSLGVFMPELIYKKRRHLWSWMYFLVLMYQKQSFAVNLSLLWIPCSRECIKSKKKYFQWYNKINKGIYQLGKWYKSIKQRFNEFLQWSNCKIYDIIELKTDTLSVNLQI